MNAGRKDLDAWLDEFAPALADGKRIPGAPVDPNMSTPAGPLHDGRTESDARSADFFESVRRDADGYDPPPGGHYAEDPTVPSLELTPADLGDDVAPSLGRWPAHGQDEAVPGWDNAAEPLGWMQSPEPAAPPVAPQTRPLSAQPGWESPGWESLSAPVPGTEPGQFGQPTTQAPLPAFGSDPYAAQPGPPAEPVSYHDPVLYQAAPQPQQYADPYPNDPYDGDPYKALQAQQAVQTHPQQVRPQDTYDGRGAVDQGWTGQGAGLPPHQTDAEFSAALGGGGAFDAAKDNPVTRFLLEWLPILIGAAIVATLVRAFVFQAYYIPSESMLPTLAEKNRVLVNKLSYDFHEVNRGDIIVFSRPESEPVSDIPDLIKRVIGLPGETIQLRNGEVYVDGALVRESYLVEQVSTRPLRNSAIPGCINGTPTDCTIPEGYVFVMGDNRGGSRDGREFGPIPVESIVGRAFVRVWPLDNLGLL